MYYVKFDSNGMQEQTIYAEEHPGEGWYPVGEDRDGKFFKLENGMAEVMTSEEFTKYLSDLNIKSIFEIAREKRDKALAMSDWTQLDSSPLSDEKKAEWEAYRQALRNYPTLLESDLNAEFPAEPQ